MSKLRVHDLAGEFGISSDEVINLLRVMDVPVRSHLSPLSDDQVARIRARWEREKRARLSTVFGFLAVLDVPINYGAIYWWETQHPKPVLGPSGGGLDPHMRIALYVSLLAFAIVYAWLITERLEVARLEDEVGALESSLEAS